MAYMRYVGKLVRKTKIMFTPGNQPLLSELQMGVGVGDFSCFSTKTYFVTPYKSRLHETVLMMGHRVCVFIERIPRLSLLPLLT